jgi:ELWxxDGT repeat protein
LWKSNANGTSLVKDIAPGLASSNVDKLTAVGGLLYFTAIDGANGVRLWKSNGTAAGTVPLGPANANPSQLANVAGTLFFSATQASSGTELWKSNGTPAGTVLVRDIKSGSASSFPLELTNVGGTLFFSADDGLSGRQLWKSNGTAAGTTLVQPTGPSFPHELTNVNGTLFFAATDSAGPHLWKSNGTSQGTVRVLGADPTANALYPEQLTNVSGTLFFVAGNDPYEDRDLWKSDGTAAGTVLVTNALFGPKELTAAGSTLYYTVRDARGEALWKSDGTVTGTVELQLFGNGSYFYENDYPGNLTSVGGKLYFSAGDLRFGNELRMVNESTSSSTGGALSSNTLQTQTVTTNSVPASASLAEVSATSLSQSTRQVETLVPAEGVKNASLKKRSDAARVELSAEAIDSLLSDPLYDWHSAWAASVKQWI